MKYHITLIFSVLFISSQAQTISGYLLDKQSKESLINANISIIGSKSISQSNTYGYFSIDIPQADSVKISISLVGYQTQVFTFSGKKNTVTKLYLEPAANTLSEIEIKGNLLPKSESSKISSIEVSIKQIKEIPSLMGEKDIIKALQMLPGVQNGNEGSNGLFVRGGGADQNLILMDEAKVYNISHLFGFFSVFNGDAIKSLEFIKGGFPARYGGRISSVLDVQMKDGNKEKTQGEVGIGLITNRITFETPIKKNKASFIFSGRRTYPDLLFSLAKDDDGAVTKSNFYDINSKLNIDINPKNKLFLSLYSGKDNFFQRINKPGDDYSNYGFSWGNNTGTFRWSHIFGQKLFSNLTLISSRFSYNVISDFGTSKEKFSSKMKELGLKYDFEYFPNNQHDIRFGIHASKLFFTPNLSISKENGSRVNYKEIEKINASDLAIYFEDIYKPTDKLSINYGLRTSTFLPDSSDTGSYQFIEPRTSLNYNFTKDWSLKGGFAIMNQPIQLISNTGLGLSIDVWVPSTKKLPPQHSHQFTLGLAHDINKGLSLEIEVYTKRMENILTFKEGSSLFTTVELFRDRNFTDKKVIWQEITTSGNGVSKGIELFLQKKQGKLSGWGSYTLSKTTYKFPELNNGIRFFPKQDRRHQLSIVSSYHPSSRITLSVNYIFASGAPVTLPKRSYEHTITDPITNKKIISFDNVIDYGSQRNDYRAKYYQRLDFSIQFIKNKKNRQQTWELGFYNITGQKNVFTYLSDINGKSIDNVFNRTKKIEKISLLLFIPSISYYIKF